jgi:hypothetical protein
MESVRIAGEMSERNSKAGISIAAPTIGMIERARIIEEKGGINGYY